MSGGLAVAAKKLKEVEVEIRNVNERIIWKKGEIQEAERELQEIKSQGYLESMIISQGKCPLS